MHIMNTVTSSNHVQIQRLTHIALILSSLAAFPGFLGSLYLLFIAANELSPETRTLNANNWLTFAPLMFAMVAGWWLYYTYWLELHGANRFGKVSWLVSALVNIGLGIYPVTTLYFMDDPFPADWLGHGFLLVWFLTMTVISGCVWLLRLRETV
jgi:hypothetical protein